MRCMASKVKVDATICDHQTAITAKDNGDGTVSIEIDTDCANVAKFARALKSANMDDLVDWKDNRILELAANNGLTTTCLIPTAVFNCCWVELGMISKRLAMQKSPLGVFFVE